MENNADAVVFVAQEKVFGVVVLLKKNVNVMLLQWLTHTLIRRLMKLIEKHVHEIEAVIVLLVLHMNFRLLDVHFGSDISKFLKNLDFDIIRLSTN